MTYSIKQYIARVGKIFLYGLTTIFLIDYILAHGGYLTILTYYHPIMLALSSTLIVSLLIWNALRAIEFALKKQWKKSLFIVICLAIIFFGSKITIKILAEKSERKAYHLVGLFFSRKDANFAVTVNEDVKKNYDKFLSEFDQSVIKLKYSYPPHGRYDYLVTPKTTEPFMLTLWVSDHGGRILITKRWGK